ncbi:MAG TPA: hypothetical protein VHY33_10445 [Thermoanaerobaculia bacterium]|nr:hypothetical protein [Thermoanaerobaculia bacterium]
MPQNYHRQQRMVFWQKFDPNAFEFEFDEEELSAHGVSASEAMAVFWNPFDVRRNKRSGTGYQLIGQTDAGRTLKLIVYERTTGVIRVIKR